MSTDLDEWKKPGKQCDRFAAAMGVPNDPEHPEYIEALKRTSHAYQGGVYDHLQQEPEPQS